MPFWSFIPRFPAQFVSKHYSRSAWVVGGPHRDELAQVVRAQDGGVPREVVKVVHDDGHEQVEHDEGAQEDEGDEVHVRHVGPAVGLNAEKI